MTLLWHEMKQEKISFFVWSISIAALMMICILLFPEMRSQMSSVSEVFSSMGSFTDAFGMDKIDFGTFKGYYAIECGNVLGIGGALYSAVTSAGALSKEESGHTAEYLLTHPISRVKVVVYKFIAVMLRILLLNLAVCTCSYMCVVYIGESAAWSGVSLIHIAYFLLQAELAGICFLVSAFMGKGSAAAGTGIALIMYFLNLISNISDKVAFLDVITPFAYAEGADIIVSGKLDMSLILPGMIYLVSGFVMALWYYTKKDIV